MKKEGAMLMRYGLRISCLIGLSFFLSLGVAFAQDPKDQSATTATVILKDGASFQVHDFAFFTAPAMPMSYYPGSRWSSTTEFMVKVGHFWRQLEPNRLMSLERQLTAKPRDDDFAQFKVVLTSGEEIRCEIPLNGSVTWLSCDGFEFSGQTSTLGVASEWSIPVKELKDIRRFPGEKDRYNIGDMSGKTKVVDGLIYKSFGQPPTYYLKEFAFTRVHKGEPGWADGWSAGQAFKVTVDRAEVPLKLEMIEKLIFPDKVDEPIAFRMRTGEEAAGQIDEEDLIYSGFGRTADGLIWFEKLQNRESHTWTIRSVVFGPLTAKQRRAK
jgi:hypothetical protein